MQTKAKNQIDMTQGSIPKNIIRFAIPLMATSFLQLLYNAADVIVVGRFAGTQALSAVGSTGALINLIINVFMGLSVGTGVCVSRNFGAKDDAAVQRSIHTSITLAFISGIIITIVGVTFSGKMLILMDTPDDVIAQAELYMVIYFCGSIFNLVYNFGAAALRAVGDTKRPLKILAFAGLINVGLNLILVIPFNMGVAGVAIATISSQAFSMVLVLRCLVKSKGSLHLDFKKLRIHKEEFIQTVKVGLPAGIQGSMFSISNVLVQSAINYFGSVVMAANAASGNIEGFIFVALNSLHQADITFTSQNIGAGKYKRVRRCLPTCMGISLLVALCVCLPSFIFAEQLISLYNTDLEVIAMGVTRLRFLALVYFLWGIMDVIVGQMRGCGSYLIPTIMSIIGICLFRVFWILVVFENFKTMTVLYYSWPISWIFTILLLLPFYFAISKKLPKEDLEHPIN